MNIIIYTLVILTIFYLLLRVISNISSKKISKSLRFLIIVSLIILAILFAVAGRFILTLPLTLRRSGRFSFNQSSSNNSSSISVSEAYKILNLDINKKVSKDDVNRAYIKIQKKIHPDVSPETSRLSSIVNEAKDIVLNHIS